MSNTTAAHDHCARTLPTARPAPDPQLAANALQLHRYLTGDSGCRCGAVVPVGARRCACGRCAECGSVYCRAGHVACEEAIEARFQRYAARVAPLARIAGLVSGETRWGASQ